MKKRNLSMYYKQNSTNNFDNTIVTARAGQLIIRMIKFIMR